jgi:hypothetical protein
MLQTRATCASCSRREPIPPWLRETATRHRRGRTGTAASPAPRCWSRRSGMWKDFKRSRAPLAGETLARLGGSSSEHHYRSPVTWLCCKMAFQRSASTGLTTGAHTGRLPRVVPRIFIDDHDVHLAHGLRFEPSRTPSLPPFSCVCPKGAVFLGVSRGRASPNEGRARYQSGRLNPMMRAPAEHFFRRALGGNV